MTTFKVTPPQKFHSITLNTASDADLFHKICKALKIGCSMEVPSIRERDRENLALGGTVAKTYCTEKELEFIRAYFERNEVPPTLQRLSPLAAK